MAYEAKNSGVEARELKVQRLVIPLTIAGNAVAASVVCRNDEPAILFLQTDGVDQITAALASGETATYTVATADATGVFRALVKIQEPIAKVCAAYGCRRDAFEVVPGRLGSASGITTGSAGGNSIMLAFDCALALNAANTLDACIVVEYVAAE